MKKLQRDMSTAENREFWKPSPRSEEIAAWPAWKRSGINVTDRRIEPPVSPTEVLASGPGED